MAEITGSSKNYKNWSIIGGTFKRQVDEGTPNAVKREFTNPSTGEEGIKFELEASGLMGKIVKCEVVTEKFGTNLKIHLSDGSDVLESIRIPYESDEFMTFAERVEGLDLSKDVVLKPYAFKDKNRSGKEVTKRGVQVIQDGETVPTNYTKDKPNGSPRVDNEMLKTMGKDYWKMFFIQKRAFLKGRLTSFIQDNLIDQGEVNKQEVVKEEVTATKQKASSKKELSNVSAGVDPLADDSDDMPF